MPDLKLLLDEHYPQRLAENLRAHGIDAEAVIVRSDLRGKDDRTVLTTARLEHRLVVTEDVTTFPSAMAIVRDYYGVLFCDSKRFPRTLSALNRLESALIHFVSDPPEAAHQPSFIWWLSLIDS